MRTLILTSLLAVVIAGCAAPQSTTRLSDYQTIQKDTRHDVDTAARDNEQALAQFEKGDFAAAEQTARQALSADVTFGPAHNTLGMVFEAGGKWDQAIDAYNDGLKLDPDNESIIANLARARLRRGDSGDEVRRLLEVVASRDDRPEWTQWAGQALIRMRPPATEPAAP